MKTKRILTSVLLVIMLLTACAPAAAADPAAVVQGFWDAMDAGNIDAAMALVAEDALCRGSCYFSGTTSFQPYLQGIIDSGATSTISNLQADGEKVTYTWEMFRNGNLQESGTESMQVQDGKITYWENLHP